MATGFITWFSVIVFAPWLPGDLLGLVIALVIVTSLTQKSDPPQPLRDSNGEEVEMKNRLGTLPLFRRAELIDSVDR